MTDLLAKNFGMGENQMLRLRNSILSKGDNDVRGAITEFIREVAGNIERDLAARKVFKTHYHLTSDEQIALSNRFEEWRFEFDGKTPDDSALRHTVNDIMIDSFVNMCGRNHRIKIYGGNFLVHAARGRTNVHSWLPVHNQYELFRNEAILEKYRSVLSGVSDDVKAVRGFVRKLLNVRQQPERWFSVDGDCATQADVFIYNHYDYDHSLTDVAGFAHKSGAKIVYGTYLLPPAMHLNPTGDFPVINGSYKLTGNSLQISVKGDVRSVRSFTLKNYETFFKSNFVTYEDSTYLVEALDMRDLLAVFRLVKVNITAGINTHCAHNIWWKDADKYYVIDRFNHDYSRGFDCTTVMKRDKLLVPVTLVEYVRNEAFGLSDDKFSISEIRPLIRGRNKIISVNGISISVDVVMDARYINDLAIAIYRDVGRSRYEWFSVLEFMLANQKFKEKIANAGLFQSLTKIFSTVYTEFYNGSVTGNFFDYLFSSVGLSQIYDRWNMAIKKKNVEFFPDVTITENVIFSRYADYLHVEHGIDTGMVFRERAFDGKFPVRKVFSDLLSSVATSIDEYKVEYSEGVLDNQVNKSTGAVVRQILDKYRSAVAMVATETVLVTDKVAGASDAIKNSGNPALGSILARLAIRYGHYREREVPLFTSEYVHVSSVEEEHIPVSRVSNPISVLQDTIMEIFPTVYTQPIEDDMAKVNFTSIDYPLSNPVSIDISKGQKLQDIVGLVPKLKTNMNTDRSQTQVDTIMGAVKRNFNATTVECPMDEDFASEVWENFIDICGTGDARANISTFQEHIADSGIDEIANWLLKAKSSVVQTLDNSDLNFHEEKFNVYGNFIKPEVKPKFGNEFLSEYSATQTVVFTSKVMNSIFSPLMNRLKNRWLSLMNERYTVNVDVSRRDLQQRFRKLVEISPLGKWLMCDYSKYDKSQQRNVMEIEWYVLKQLGMESYLHSIWIQGHCQTTFSSFIAGFKAYLEMQRKSGDSATAFLNSLTTYLTVMWGVRHYKALLVGGDVIGDDILLRILSEFSLEGINENIYYKFNLQAKLFIKDYADYCSSFVLSNGELIPDVLKYVIKLGKNTIVGNTIVDMEAWSEKDKNYFSKFISDGNNFKSFKKDLRFDSVAVNKKLFDMFISARDHFWNLDNSASLDELNAVMQVHHRKNVDFVPMIRAVVTLHDDFMLYRTLYSEEVISRKQ